MGNRMSQGNNGHLLDYIGYKNKLRTLQWEERLWRQHLEGTPRDIRQDEERQRYGTLQSRAVELRALAERLYRRRLGHQPQFAAR
jgi:hypothetical protein